MTIEPPDYIDDRAREEFARVVKLLGPRAQESDVYIIAEFAQAMSDIVTLQELVAIEGNVIVNPDSGLQKPNPNATILIQRRAALGRLMRELNLTPKSRKEKPAKSDKRLKDLL